MRPINWYVTIVNAVSFEIDSPKLGIQSLRTLSSLELLNSKGWVKGDIGYRNGIFDLHGDILTIQQSWLNIWWSNSFECIVEASTKGIRQKASLLISLKNLLRRVYCCLADHWSFREGGNVIGEDIAWVA